MGPRVIKIREAAKNYESWMKEFSLIQQESLRQEEEARRVERIASLIEKIPLRFRNKSFHDYFTDIPEQGRIKNIARRYVDSFKERSTDGTSLVFRGKPGTGKALLSLIMYQALAKAGFHVHYEPSLEFLRTLIDTKFKSQTLYQNALDALDRVQFFILDEVTEPVSKGGTLNELEGQVLFQIINRRYEKNLCTLVITNRDHDEFVKRLGVPITDRLADKGIVLAFNWHSYRQK